MSSRELLALIEEFPETSRYKEAAERTFRVAEYRGAGEHKGKLLQFAGARPLEPVSIPKANADGSTWVIRPDDLEVVAYFVDWTYDRKLAARQTAEFAALRMELRKPGEGYEVDFTGLMEPLQQVLADRQKRAAAANIAGAKSVIRRGLFGKGGEPQS